MAQQAGIFSDRRTAARAIRGGAEGFGDMAIDGETFLMVGSGGGGGFVRSIHVPQRN